MNPYVTGAMIKELREKKHMTQAELAEKLSLSDKTISKWETAKGYPDITLLEPLAKVFGVSIAELFSGSAICNQNVSSNMLRSKFYVCPICGNVIHSVGEAAIHCHGILLTPEEAEESDENHIIMVERVEQDYYVQIHHEMTKQHHISFVAAVSIDGIMIKKLYPEGNAEARFPMSGVKRIYYYCNRDGLFWLEVNPHVDGKEHSYEDVEERRELEQIANQILG